MKICKVNSLPLKEVIESLAKCFNVDYYTSCTEHYINIPPAWGKGQIRGINFDNGLGMIIYQCEFLEDVRIDFTVGKVHPIKYIYSVNGLIRHRFENGNEEHYIEKYKCAIVASQSHNGHVLTFEKKKSIEIVSLEIDRSKFLKTSSCEILDISETLREIYEDVEAENSFYHEGFYGLEFRTILNNISRYEGHKLVRKFYLESISLQIFINQILQFDDDLLNELDKTILRINELDRVENISSYISKNIDKELAIPTLTKMAGINPNKLQLAFKHLYGKTVNEYVTSVRMATSLKLLKDKDLNVSEVVLRIGFKSYSYFSKLFKEHYGITPSKYKNFHS